MLETLRRGATGWIAKILLGLLILSFAVWGVADMITGRSSTTLARVGDLKISESEFRDAQQLQMDLIARQFGQRPGAELARPIAMATLQRLMNGAAVEEHARRLNLAVSQKSVVAGVEADPTFHGADGKFSKGQLQAVLDNLRISERQFIEDRRKEALRGQLTDSLAAATVVPDSLVGLVHAFRNDKRRIAYFPVTPAKDAKPAEPTDDQLKSAYEQSKGKYVTPETRRIGVLALSAEALKKRLAVSDADISAAYEQEKDSFQVPERRRIRQLAFPDKATAEAALKEIRDGKSFDDVAKARGATDKDTDLGLLAKSDLIDKAIADAAFALAKDKFSEPVEGRFTTVILTVTSIEPGRLRALDEVKSEIRDRLAGGRIGGEMQKLHDAVDDQKLKGKSLKEIGEALGVPFVEVAAITRNGTTPDGKPIEGLAEHQRVAAAAFQSAVGLESEVIELSDGGYAWVDVLAVTPQKQKELAEVRDQVKTAWIEAEADKALRTRADDLVKRLDAGEDIAAVAKSAAAEVKTSEPFDRRTSVPDVSSAAVRRAFTLAKGKAASVAGTNDKGRFVMQVAEILPAGEPKTEEADAIRRELRQQRQGELITEYVTGLRDNYGATYDRAMLDRMLGVPGQQ
ncbi:MAG: SurA N-terminal domain-containing protein [Hyphomicrobiaceae bacterium]